MGGQRGQATVELAVVLPFLVLVLLGIAEMGMMLGSYLSVQSLAQDGSRDVALGLSEGAIISQLNGQVPANLQAGNVSVTFSPDAGTGGWTFGTPVTVLVRYPYAVDLPIISTIIGSQVNLSSSLVQPAG